MPTVGNMCIQLCRPWWDKDRVKGKSHGFPALSRTWIIKGVTPRLAWGKSTFGRSVPVTWLDLHTRVVFQKLIGFRNSSRPYLWRTTWCYNVEGILTEDKELMSCSLDVLESSPASSIGGLNFRWRTRGRKWKEYVPVCCRLLFLTGFIEWIVGKAADFNHVAENCFAWWRHRWDNMYVEEAIQWR